MKDNSLSLNEVKSHFEHWRATKTKMREPIPQYLWDEVKKLTEWHQLGEIAQSLRLNTTQIKDNLGLRTKVNFAEVKLETPMIHNNSSILSNVIKGQAYSIEIQRPNGTVLRINSLAAESINKIISQFIG